ncbi:MAG: hypothetical protein LBK58_02990 [Prevotellaceae bacterium]|jgi:hypothetical protein|nr:hypothetical protein [Prevotellaceae bacterium]
MLRGSLIPGPVIQELRVYFRKYTRLQGQLTGTLQEMDRVMVMCGYRISSCMSSPGTKSVMNIIQALIDKKTGPCELEKPVYGSTANKKSGKLLESLTGNMKEHHRQQLEWKKEECIKQMERICTEHFSKEMELLKSIPGAGDRRRYECL